MHEQRLARGLACFYMDTLLLGLAEGLPLLRQIETFREFLHMFEVTDIADRLQTPRTGGSGWSSAAAAGMSGAGSFKAPLIV